MHTQVYDTPRMARRRRRFLEAMLLGLLVGLGISWAAFLLLALTASEPEPHLFQCVIYEQQLPPPDIFDAADVGANGRQPRMVCLEETR